MSKVEGYKVICVPWYESEQGWGQRGDGVSLHLDSETAEEYKTNHMEWQSSLHPEGEVPYEYNFAERGKEILVNKTLYNKIKKSKNGTLRLDNFEYRKVRKEFVMG